MDKAVVERAVKALAAIGASSRPVAQASPARRIQPTPAPAAPPTERPDVAACGDPACAECYDVGDGRRIHPPRWGRDYLDWLKKWEGKGQVQ